MFRTKAKRNTLVRASYACEKWPCQTPSHGSDACGLGSQRTVAKEAEGLFPQSLLFPKSHANVVSLNFPKETLELS